MIKRKSSDADMEKEQFKVNEMRELLILIVLWTMIRKLEKNRELGLLKVT